MSDRRYIKMQKKLKEIQNLYSWSEFHRSRKHLKNYKQIDSIQVDIVKVKKEINELKKKK